MARTIKEIQDDLIAQVQTDATLAALLTSTSRTAIWRLWIFIIAVVCWTLEQLHDLFKADVNEIIAEKVPHSLRWYVKKAKEFQYGYNLVPERDYYDNTGIPDDVVAASKIVAYAAFTVEPNVRMKLAKKVGNNLAPLTPVERLAFVAYARRFRDAGVPLKDSTITSTNPDKLRVVIRARYNPLILNANGERLDGADNFPLRNGGKDYLQNVVFNGLVSVQKFVDRMQKVEGIDDLHIDEIQSQYGALPFTSIDIDVIPDSGYMIIEDVDFVVTYYAQQ
jgi:hypothetical protein